MLANRKYATIGVVETEELDTFETTYNFEVEDVHTYFVGSESILVHNLCATIDGKKVYRGQPKNPNLKVFEAVPDELVIKDGLVTLEGGVSVNTNIKSLKRFGKIYVVESIPNELIFSPNISGHNLIVPKTPMPLNEYQQLLSQISYKCIS